MNKIKKLRVGIVAAGTGGHIYPGLSLAEELKLKINNCEFVFFGSPDRLEAKIIPNAGYKILFIKAGRWKGRGIFGKFFGAANIFFGFAQILIYLIKNPRPEILISVGGYVSVPVVLATRLFNIPFFIVEPNICSGLANRVLSIFAKKAYSVPGGDAERKLFCPVENLGNPIRSFVTTQEVGLSVQNILIMGGSQGALSLCKAALYLALAVKNGKLKSPSGPLKIILQSGEAQYNDIVNKVKEEGLEDFIEVKSFIENIPKLFSEVQLVISRAGAMSVAELCQSGLAVIFVPFPYAADDHQSINARLLEKAGAAICLNEKEPQFHEKLLDQVLDLVQSEEAYFKRQKLSQKIKLWSRPQATQDIVKSILDSLSNFGN